MFGGRSFPVAPVLMLDRQFWLNATYCGIVADERGLIGPAFKDVNGEIVMVVAGQDGTQSFLQMVKPFGDISPVRAGATL